MQDADGAIDRRAAGAALAAAVRAGGELALGKFRSDFKSWTKGGDSPVSEVDLAVNDLLQERLTAALPSAGWLSEESVDDDARLTRDLVWIVDPIDGTRAFIAGREDWTICAALTQRGRPILGAIFAPVENSLFFASAGKGATLNDAPLAITEADAIDGARVSGPKPIAEALMTRYRINALPRIHSLALRLVRVADGTLDIAFAGGNSHDWDIAAADLIVHEAGGVLTRLDGEDIAYNRPRPSHGPLVATGRARHESVVRFLQDRRIAVR